MGRINRRSFIKGTMAGAAILGAPTIIPSSVLGENAPSKRVNLAAIGVGGRGYSVVVRGFCGLDGARVVACVDPNKNRREKASKDINERYKGEYCKSFENYQDVLSNKDIDGVVIATPDHWHVPIAVAAARAGKDMYVEKPLSIALNWSKVLRAELKKNNCIFQYGTQQRSTGAARDVMELVWNGYIGEVKRVDVSSPNLGADVICHPKATPVPDGFNWDLWQGPAPLREYSKERVTNTKGTWHCYDYALGFIAGWGAHPLDILQWGLQMDQSAPVEYEGTGFVPENAGLCNTLRTWDIHLKYANGMPVHFMDAATAKKVIKPYHERMQGDGTVFHGTEGWACYQRSKCYLKIKGKYVNANSIERKASDKKAYLSSSQHGNFVDCMKSRKTTVNPIESAIRSDTISHMCDIAARTGCKISYDPLKEVIVGDAKSSQMMDRPMRKPYVI